MRELLTSYPGSSHFLPDEERYGPSVGHQLVPQWQLADAAKRAKRVGVRREQMRYHTQRQEAVAAARQRAFESGHDARLDSLVAQQQRYMHAVATENKAFLRNQATYRHIIPGRPNQMPEQAAVDD